MRIAGRPTLAKPFPSSPPLVALAGAAVLVLAIAVGFSLLSPWSSRDEAGGNDGPLTMADAFGVGGLAQLRIADGAAPSPLAAGEVVAYYGSPRIATMGILGQHDPQELAWLLLDRAKRFDALNGDARVLPALHLVFGVAQPEPGAGGLHLRYVDDQTVRQYLAVAREHGFALILDMQIGHSDPLTEVKKLAPYLGEPDVHVALDPEFALAGGARPGDAIGSVSAAQLNAVQGYLADAARTAGVPPKMLVVHQFQPEMITNAAAIRRTEGVELIINMDGYGPGDIKAVKYARYAGAAHAPHGGIKVFLQHDPDPLTEAQMLALEPRPAFFMFQ